MLATMPGIDMSHTEQLDYYQELLKQYKRENELLSTYKDICTFDISKLEKEVTADDLTIIKQEPQSTKTTQQIENNIDESTSESKPS